MPPKRQSQDPSLKSEEVTDTSSRRLNGSKTKPTSKRSASENASGKDRAPRKPARKPASRPDATAAKKAKRITKKERDAAAAMQTSTKATSKRKPKPPTGSARAAFAVKEEDVSSEEEDDGCARVYDSLPSIGDEVAIKCPPDPPFPEGWYAAVVIDVIEHRVEGKPPSSKAKGKAKVVKDFTLQVEWDGGGVEDLRNPEWRMKVDAPDKQGKISHRDTKLRPYFKYWVTRLNAMDEAEKKLGRTRAGKNLRIDPNQKVEWIQCADPNCGKWRALPPYMKSSAILETCDNKWFCVLNSWDEAIASCGAPQETGYMPSSSTA
eukprot:CAMPEP_0201696660 /NCGR_PEP_ID=MMETSP0578-20130828/8251_1 /ASSEMBLY_ACC=CAM_ASM_000663 /TAXON_ID=267565 /ORGANISM="Skeletonema grethea, Strain CCMP 1804" /LENGTH=320 /DNA_ID=CAMNT_0048182681 /DNA_START=148 /DNA_END=1110 /DNA_ORIENTATION=+